MNLIASLVNASGWRTIKKTRTTSNCGPEECNVPTSGSQNKGTKRHLNTDEQVEHEKCKQQKRDGNRCNKRAANAQADNNVLVKRRCRGKQADPRQGCSSSRIRSSEKNSPTTKQEHQFVDVLRVPPSLMMEKLTGVEKCCLFLFGRKWKSFTNMNA